MIKKTGIISFNLTGVKWYLAILFSILAIILEIAIVLVGTLGFCWAFNLPFEFKYCIGVYIVYATIGMVVKNE